MSVSDGFALDRPFTRGQAHLGGVSRSALRHLQTSGIIRRILNDVYVDAAVADSLELRAAALTLVAPPHAIVCDRTAAWLLGVDLQAEVNLMWLPPLDIYRAEGLGGLRREQCNRGKRTLQPHDVIEIGGVRVTSPLRTALDLGRLSRRPDAYTALNAIARSAGFGRDRLTAELPRFRGMRGVVQLRSLVALVDPRMESPAESRLFLQLVDDGLPAPTPQWHIFDLEGLVLYRLDFAYEELMLGLEYNGREFHSSPDQVRRDRERLEYLRSRGWVIVVLTADDVFGPRPRAADIVRAALRDARSGGRAFDRGASM